MEELDKASQPIGFQISFCRQCDWPINSCIHVRIQEIVTGQRIRPYGNFLIEKRKHEYMEDLSLGFETLAEKHLI